MKIALWILIVLCIALAITSGYFGVSAYKLETALEFKACPLTLLSATFTFLWIVIAATLSGFVRDKVVMSQIH